MGGTLGLWAWDCWGACRRCFVGVAAEIVWWSFGLATYEAPVVEMTGFGYCRFGWNKGWFSVVVRQLMMVQRWYWWWLVVPARTLLDGCPVVSLFCVEIFFSISDLYVRMPAPLFYRIYCCSLFPDVGDCGVYYYCCYFVIAPPFVFCPNVPLIPLLFFFCDMEILVWRAFSDSLLRCSVMLSSFL